MRCCVYADVGLHIFSKTQPRDIPSSRKEHSLFDRTVESILTRMLHAAVPAVFNVQCCNVGHVVLVRCVHALPRSLRLRERRVAARTA